MHGGSLSVFAYNYIEHLSHCLLLESLIKYCCFIKKMSVFLQSLCVLTFPTLPTVKLFTMLTLRLRLMWIPRQCTAVPLGSFYRVLMRGLVREILVMESGVLWNLLVQVRKLVRQFYYL